MGWVAMAARESLTPFPARLWFTALVVAPWGMDRVVSAVRMRVMPVFTTARALALELLIPVVAVVADTMRRVKAQRVWWWSQGR